MARIETEGVSIVGAGAFNPSILHPSWLAGKGLLGKNEAEFATAPANAQPLIVTAQFAVYATDWVSVRVTPQQMILTTLDQSRESRLKDLALGIFRYLPETPVDAIGLNVEVHAEASSIENWHRFGDHFAPKEPWHPIFASQHWVQRGDGEVPGMNTVSVQVQAPSDAPGYMIVTLQPSVKVPVNGIFISLNRHFQLSKESSRATAGDASQAIEKFWTATRSDEREIIQRILKDT